MAGPILVPVHDPRATLTAMAWEIEPIPCRWRSGQGQSEFGQTCSCLRNAASTRF